MSLQSELGVPQQYTLTLSCRDVPGIVADVSRCLFECGGNIVEAAQMEDAMSGRFFMRVGVAIEDAGAAAVRASFGDIARKFDMQWRLTDSSERKRVVLLVSKFDHCLGDLLYRHRLGELDMDVVGIISNHPRSSLNVSLVGDIPFHYLPVTKETKSEQEAQIREIVDDTNADLIVLARYMQILSDDFARYLSGRCINIHHSFLFALPEGQRGIFVGGGGSVRIARLMTAARMTELMLTGRVLTVVEAERFNLVNYVVPNGTAFEKARALAKQIATNAPLSNYAITTALPRIQDMAQDDGLFVESLMAAFTQTSSEAAKRLNEFMEKKAARIAPNSERI